MWFCQFNTKVVTRWWCLLDLKFTTTTLLVQGRWNLNGHWLILKSLSHVKLLRSFSVDFSRIDKWSRDSWPHLFFCFLLIIPVKTIKTGWKTCMLQRSEKQQLFSHLGDSQLLNLTSHSINYYEYDKSFAKKLLYYGHYLKWSFINKMVLSLILSICKFNKNVSKPQLR